MASRTSRVLESAFALVAGLAVACGSTATTPPGWSSGSSSGNATASGAAGSGTPGSGISAASGDTSSTGAGTGSNAGSGTTPVDDGGAGGSGGSGSAGTDGGGSSSDGGTWTGAGGDGGVPAGFWDTAAPVPAAKNAAMFVFLNRTNGAYADKDVYWSFNHATVPVINELHSIADMPMYDMPANGSGRMYFYVGGPTSQYNDFIEFTIGGSFNGNTTRVDAFGLPIAMRVLCSDGYDIAVGDSYEIFLTDRMTVFQQFIDFVPTEFKSLGTVKAPYKIPEPGGQAQFKAGGMYGTYFDAYYTQVWTAQGYTTAKPGPFTSGLGANPSLSAALNRHVAHLPVAQWADKTGASFYQAAPANYYAAFWHKHALLGRAYGFPYDDVGGWSSYVSHKLPGTVYIAIGY
jgi:hypothetical protein